VKENKNFQREKQYREELEAYRLLNKQKSDIESRMDEIKSRIAAMMHEDKINDKTVELSNGEEWTVAYQTTTRTSTDLKLLLEIVGPKVYDEIITQKSSTFMVIRKAGKKKKDINVHTKPVEDEVIVPTVPNGTILS